MLLEQTKAAVVQFHEHSITKLAGALGDKVDYLRLRLAIDEPSHLLNP